jgi:hypothetical protein
MEKQFFHPLDFALVDGVTVRHFVSLIHAAHVTDVIQMGRSSDFKCRLIFRMDGRTDSKLQGKNVALPHLTTYFSY